MCGLLARHWPLGCLRHTVCVACGWEESRFGLRCISGIFYVDSSLSSLCVASSMCGCSVLALLLQVVVGQHC